MILILRIIYVSRERQYRRSHNEWDAIYDHLQSLPEKELAVVKQPGEIVFSITQKVLNT